MSCKKDLNVLLDRARSQGCTITLRRNGHYRVCLPNGSIMFCSQTPSDFRAIHKIRAHLRREGLKL